ncbi:YbbR-like domain-containing protein [Desulfitobacterium sp. Sab5]|uniref:CdaR family protein n=1 Tax=Desulfitobacterium nosdiversum TaxID=3375356 RepID=UPI003CED9480
MHEVFKRNLGYKIVSLLLAILFWLWVTNTSTGSSVSLDGDQTLTIPLVTQNVPANSVVMTKLPSVRVRLQGTNPSVNVKDLFAYVDLSGAKPGEHNFAIKMDAIPGIQIMELNPQNITLNIDTVQEKMLPVQASVSGTPAEGKEVGNLIIKPSVVNVRGPGSVLAALDKVVVNVNIAGVSDSFAKSLPVLFRDKKGDLIFNPDPNIEIMNATPNSVDVVVPILPKGSASKTIPIKVTSKGDPAAGMSLRSLQVVPDRVQVWGTTDALKNIDVLDLGTVDLTGLTEDKSIQISGGKVSLPNGITFGPGTNFTVVASIGKSAQSKTISGVPVTVKNVPSDLVLDQSPGSVDVTVEGLPEVLNTLTASQISLWVDANGQTAGIHSDVKPYWQLPSGVQMVSVPNVSYSLKGK